MRICCKCKRREVEVIDDWISNYCDYCNDGFIDQSNKRQEWDHYHPGEPCPKSELGPHDD